MRSFAAGLVLVLLLPGCLGGDDALDEEADAAAPGTPSAQFPASGASANATYLQNLDYSREHLHDYWEGATRKLLMDEAFSTDTPTSAFVTLFGVLIDGSPRTGVGWLEFTLPNGTFVPEGTGELLVEIDATGSLKSGEMVFGYQPANAGTFTEMEPSAATGNWTIALAPEMSDVPHAKSTRWNFRLEAGPGGVIDGAFNVKVTAARLFEISSWPEHPDFWDLGNIAKLDLGNTTGDYDHLSQHVIGREANAEFEIIEPAGIVPPETRALVVTLTFERNEADPKNMINGPLILTVRDGASSRQTKVMHGNVIIDEPGRKVYAIPVDSSNWDSPYVSESGWFFQLHTPFGVHDIPPGSGDTDIGGLDVGSGTYDVGIVAYRVIPPWLADVLPEDIGR